MRPYADVRPGRRVGVEEVAARNWFHAHSPLTPYQLKLRCLNRTAINPAICSCYTRSPCSCTLSDL